MGILPVINCADFASVKETVEKAKKFLPEGSFLHCDIADGTFTFARTWNNPAEWGSLHAPYALEVHLMVEHPEKQIEPWITAGAKRFVLSFETLNDATMTEILKTCADHGVAVALSSNPETTVDRLASSLKLFGMLQVLCVHPGLAGQPFLPLMLEKIKWIRRQYPNVILEVDGGMTPDTAKLVKSVGADFIVSASYIFNNPNPGEAYQSLKMVN